MMYKRPPIHFMQLQRFYYFLQGRLCKHVKRHFAVTNHSQITGIYWHTMEHDQRLNDILSISAPRFTVYSSGPYALPYVKSPA